MVEETKGNKFDPKKAEAVEAKQKIDDLKELKSKIEKKLQIISGEIEKLENEAEEVAKGEKEPYTGVLPRLTFKRIGTTFFVDFTLAATGDEMALEGKVIYGALRPTATDDQVKYKPLFECPVSRNGLIKDPGGIKGQWMINKDEGNFADVHFLILQNIWKDALNWANEYPTD